MNMIPTAKTMHLASLMIRQARKDNGADAALTYLGELRPEQCAALIGYLLQRVANAEGRTHVRFGSRAGALSP